MKTTINDFYLNIQFFFRELIKQKNPEAFKECAFNPVLVKIEVTDDNKLKVTFREMFTSKTFTEVFKFDEKLLITEKKGF